MEMIEKAVPASTSPLSAIVRMFYEPRAVFEQLEQRRATWVALALLIGSAVVMSVWYFQFVDFAWLQESMLAAVTDPNAREKAREMSMGQGSMTALGVVGAVFGYLVSFTIGGIYYLIVSKVRNVEFSFGKGFALSVWGSIPMLLLFPLGAMQILLSSTNQIPFEALNPLSLNELVFHYEAGTPMAGVFNALSIPMFWSMVLTIIGYEVWGKASRTTAAITVLVPTVVIYGGWLAWALSSAA